MSYQAIVFDFFGVIRSDEYLGWLERHGLSREGIYAEASHQADMNKITMAGFFGFLEKQTGIPKDDIASDFASHAQMHPDLIELISTLKQHYKIGLLSNSNSDQLRRILREHHLEDLFDVIVISGEVGLVKPEPAIFRYLLKELDMQSNEVIFIDDSPYNMAAAQALGITSILYRNIEQLRKTLVEYDIDLGE